jgi:hypothetical protein
MKKHTHSSPSKDKRPTSRLAEHKEFRALQPLCIAFDIQAQPRPDSLRILLTLLVSLTRVSSCVGPLSVGLRRFLLEIKLTNGEMPASTRALNPGLLGAVEKTIKSTISGEASHNRKSETGLTASFSRVAPKLDAQTKDTSDRNRKQADERSEEFTRLDRQVTPGGEDTAPHWWFEDKQGRCALEGAERDMELGELITQPGTCVLDMQATVLDSDLFVDFRDSLLSERVANNIIVKRLVVKRWLLKNRCEPYLNRKVYEVT